MSMCTPERKNISKVKIPILVIYCKKNIANMNFNNIGNGDIYDKRWMNHKKRTKMANTSAPARTHGSEIIT